MLLAIDVHYLEQSSAVVAGALFESWTSSEASQELCTKVLDVHEYIPGQFYLRELPCIMALLSELKELPDLIVIDGFVTLGEEAKPGLGQYLYLELGERVPVVGVAKKAFKDTPEDTEVFRGESAKPLFVTSVGVPQESAKAWVKGMFGASRLPVLLRQVDRLCRSGCAGQLAC